jgi:hypothetical protein
VVFAAVRKTHRLHSRFNFSYAVDFIAFKNAIRFGESRFLFPRAQIISRSPRMPRTIAVAPLRCNRIRKTFVPLD